MASRDWAVITGASSGIGEAFASVFASKGINLVMTSRDVTKLTSEATTLEKKHGIKTIIYAGDLTLPSDTEGLIRVVLEAKIRVRYVINSAGFGSYGSFINSSWEREQDMISLNISALTYLNKAFSSYMVKRRQGHIVNLASTAAFLPGPNMAVYFASKAYVLHLSEAINEELKGTGVSVTALCPGPTRTNFADAASADRSSFFSGKLPTAYQVATYGYDAMVKHKPVAIYGIRNKLIIAAIRFLPRSLVPRLLADSQR